MHYFPRFLALMTTVAMVGGGALSYAEDAQKDRWILFGDFVYMQRARGQSHIIVDKDEDGALNSGALVHEFDFEPGFRAGLMFLKSPHTSFEGNVLYIDEWNGSKSVKGLDNLSFPFDSSGYATGLEDAYKAKGSYQSQFWDLEVNLWHHTNPRFIDFFSLSGIAGGRYFNLDEHLTVDFTKSSGTSFYKTSSRNHLYGLQLGGNFQMNPTHYLSWDLTGKFGGFGNHEQETNHIVSAGSTIRNTRERKWEPGYFAEALAQMTIRFVPCFHLRAGYQFLYFNGLALAPSQLDKGTGEGSGKEVHADGVIMIQGLFLGLEFKF